MVGGELCVCQLGVTPPHAGIDRVGLAMSQVGGGTVSEVGVFSLSGATRYVRASLRPVPIGDGGPAVLAAMAPVGVGTDGSGNLYIADVALNGIRRVDHATQTITSIAGQPPTSGFAGDGGVATSALLRTPTDIDHDGSDFYLVDQQKLVRKIDGGTGIITTVAGDLAASDCTGVGGPATSAGLELIEDVARDNTTGDLYIGGQGCHVVYRVDGTTGTLTTVAGTGTGGCTGDGGLATAAQLSTPWGVMFAANGDIYVVDPGCHGVRRIDHTTGIIAAFAGTGTAGNSGDGGLATLAQLDVPYAIGRNSVGDIGIIDAAAAVLRLVDHTTGIITTLAGTGTAGFSGDGGAATAAQLTSPQYVTFDSADNVFIADFGNHRVRRIDQGTGIITTVAGSGLSDPFGSGLTVANLDASAPVPGGPIWWCEGGDAPGGTLASPQGDQIGRASPQLGPPTAYFTASCPGGTMPATITPPSPLTLSNIDALSQVLPPAISFIRVP